MTKIELCKEEIKVIEEQLAGKIEIYSATEEQQKWLMQVIDKAEALLYENPDDEDFSTDLIEWFYNKYKKQEGLA